MRPHARTGLTVVELLIAMALLSIVGGAVVSVYLSSDRTYRVGSDLAEAQATARVAMARLEREVRSGSRDSVDSSLLPTELVFASLQPNETSLTEVRYYLDEEGYLIREANGGARRVAHDVGDFQVAMSGGEVLEVQLLIDVRGRQAALDTAVGFRNP